MISQERLVAVELLRSYFRTGNESVSFLVGAWDPKKTQGTPSQLWYSMMAFLKVFVISTFVLVHSSCQIL